MSYTAHGRISGKTSELDEDLGVANGQEVEVIVHVKQKRESCGEGIRRSAGVAADVADFDEVFSQIECERKTARFRDIGE